MKFYLNKTIQKVIIFFIILLSCTNTQENLDPVDSVPDFQAAFMKSYDVTTGNFDNRDIPGAVFSNPLNRATVPLTTPLNFENGTIANYPEPGLTTNYTVALFDSTNNVYRIDATTVFPATHVISTYLESHYVQDTATLTVWSIDDPIVKQESSVWVSDEKARIQMMINFRDGSTRTEYLVSDSNAGGDLFDGFDIDGSLDFASLYYPAADSNAVYSSITTYYDTMDENHNYWFWEGTIGQTIAGVRYYTEHKTSTQYICDTLLYEKTISAIQTIDGELTNTLSKVYIDNGVDTLALSVVRQRIVYPLDESGNPVFASGIKDTRMKTKVVNISGLQDFFIERANSESAALTSYDTSTIYVPSGDAPEIPGTIVPTILTITQIENSDGLSIPIITADPGSSALANLYSSITNGANTALILSDLPSSISTIDSNNEILEFDGSKGKIYENSAYNLTTKGTVEAWVFVDKYTETAGIVHKGVNSDFSDEAYSLQFLGSKGDLVFAVVKQGPYAYDLVTAKTKLNKNKWYYIVGSWDTDPNGDGNKSDSFIKIFVNGQLSASGKLTNVPNGPAAGGPLVIGSQLCDSAQRITGYYGFDGRINGVRVYNESIKNNDTVSAFYTTYNDLPKNWK